MVQQTARALTDLIDAQRSVRLEATIVLLIVFEILITFYELISDSGAKAFSSEVVPVRVKKMRKIRNLERTT